jgi:TolB protein
MIAYTRFTNDQGDIWVMNADGSNQHQVTDSPQDEGDVAWSPDGRRLAFGRGEKEVERTIWLMNADGTEPTQITFTAGDPDSDEPTWSPDGTMLAVSYWNGDSVDIAVMNSDGTGFTRLTTNADDDFHPAWGPSAP